MRWRWLEEYCHVCGRQLNGWDARIEKAREKRRRDNNETGQLSIFDMMEGAERQ